MSYAWFIGRRYLQAGRREGFVSFITGFAVLGVTIGTAGVIVALSVLNGFEREIKEKVFSFTSHVQIVGFQNQPLRDYARSMESVRRNVPHVRAIAPFVAREAMMRAGDKVDGIVLKGIDARLDVNSTSRYLVEGDFLDAAESRPQAVIGRKLAGKLGIGLGSRVIVFGLPRGRGMELSAAQPRAMVFSVVGLFESGMAEYDDIYVFTSLQNAQKLFQLDDAVLGFDVLTDDLDQAPAVAMDAQKLLGYPHYARTAAQLYKNLFAWIELQKKPAPILLGLVVIVATVNIVGTLLMLVLGKTRDIGILKSIGATPRGIRRIFLIQGLVIGVLGVLLGNALAFGLCWFQLTMKPLSLPSDIYFMSTVPILMRYGNFVLVSAVILALCAAASLIPSLAASRLDPVRTLRFG